VVEVRTRLAAAIVLAAFLAAVPARTAAEEWSMPPVVSTDLVVEGAWRMDRDVVVQKGATLRILPGARIVVEGRDRGKAGDDPDRCELHVHGRISIEGTAAAPVVIEPGPPGDAKAAGAPWMGIVLHADRARTPDSVLSFAKIRGAHQAVQVTDGAPRIESCVFHGCTVGVAAGRLWSRDRRVVEESRSPQPEIEGSLFVRCSTGVFAESQAGPTVTRCSFLDCQVGLGNTRWGWLVSRPASLGAHVSRSLFLRCEVAVEGASLVEDSLFGRNQVVLDVTRLHGKFSTGIDRIAWRRNVLWANVCVATGESDLGGDERFVDPKLATVPDVPSFADARAPLAGVELAADSPVRGTALDGGDPGPSGRGPSGRRRRPWVSRTRALHRFLVLGPPDKVDANRLPKAAPAAAGEKVGDAWWCAFDADDAGGLDRASLGWPDKSPVVPLAVLWTVAGSGGGGDAGAIAEAEVNADGVTALWRGGASIPFPEASLRHGVRGVRVPLVASGASGLLLWWRCTDLDPRIGVAIHAAAGAGATATDVPLPPGGALEAEPIRFGPKQIGLRVKSPFHWADLRRPGVVRLVAADGSAQDLTSIQAIDAKGTLRADLPVGAVKATSKLVIDGLRDPWGRVLAGQPMEIDVEPR